MEGSRLSPPGNQRWPLNNTSSHLLQLNGFKKCLKVALSKTIIPLTLDELKKYRPYHVGGSVDGAGPEVAGHAQ